jgi:hypothetical protein
MRVLMRLGRVGPGGRDLDLAGIGVQGAGGGSAAGSGWNLLTKSGSGS